MESGTFTMTARELQRYHLLKKVIAGEVTLSAVAIAMGVSYRQAKRLKAQVAAHGARGIVHQNRGRPPANKLPAAQRAELLTLCQERYAGCNDTHCVELLASQDGLEVSRETVRRLRRQAGIAPKRKRRVRAKHHKRRERKPAAGMMLQWDGSHHRWFGPEHPACCLLAAIDDATSDAVTLHLAPGETSAAYLTVLRQVVEQHGIPSSIYQDRHGALKRNDDSWSLQEQLDGEQEPTQVGRALQELGITPLFAHSPQAKGRVERLFGTLQDRLPAELRLAGITDLEAANAFLPGFLTRHNARFAVAPAEEKAVWRRLPAGADLDRVLAFRYQAVVGQDNAVRLGGHVLDLPPGPRGRGYAKRRVEVRQLLDGRWRVYDGNTLLLEAPATEVVEPLRRRKSLPHAPGAHEVEWVYLASAAPVRGAGAPARQRGHGRLCTRIA